MAKVMVEPGGNWSASISPECTCVATSAGCRMVAFTRVRVLPSVWFMVMGVSASVQVAFRMASETVAFAVLAFC